MRQPAPQPKLNLRKLESIERVLRYGAAVVLVVFLALIAFSGYKLRQINKTIDDKQARLAVLDETLQRKEGELAERNRTIEALDVTVETLIDPQRPLSAEQAKEVEKTIEQNVAEMGGGEQIPPRVYLQIGREEQRKSAGEVARRLQARGFLAPGVENVRGRAPRVSELRYFQTDEVAQADVRNLMEFFRGIGVRLGRPVLVRDAKDVRPRQYEVWLGEDFARVADARPTPTPEPTPTPTPEPTREPTPRPTRGPRQRPTPIFSPKRTPDLRRRPG